MTIPHPGFDRDMPYVAAVGAADGMRLVRLACDAAIPVGDAA
jgi:hypothetical protein